MNNIREILKKYACNPCRYTIKNDVTIVDTDNRHFVFKKRKRDNNVKNLFKYLTSRNFNYFPNLISIEDEYDVYEYIEETDTPREQKAEDIMYLLSLLHNKTTYYQEMDIDEYKETYEKINNNLDYIYYYYNDIISSIEQKTYMSPSEYLIARNISKIMNCISFCKNEVEKWYQLIKNKPKKRLVTIHNNIDVDHFLRNENLYLISWDNAKRDLPIYDIYNFYKKDVFNYDFNKLLEIYESKYPLLKEEKKLLFLLLSIPEKFEFTNNEFENCKKARRLFDYLYKTEMLITPYYTEQNNKQTNDFNQ